jgi:hypothetical protein
MTGYMARRVSRGSTVCSGPGYQYRLARGQARQHATSAIPVTLCGACQFDPARAQPLLTGLSEPSRLKLAQLSARG